MPKRISPSDIVRFRTEPLSLTLCASQAGRACPEGPGNRADTRETCTASISPAPAGQPDWEALARSVVCLHAGECQTSDDRLLLILRRLDEIESHRLFGTTWQSSKTELIETEEGDPNGRASAEAP